MPSGSQKRNEFQLRKKLTCITDLQEITRAKEAIRENGRHRLVERWQTRWHSEQTRRRTYRLIPELTIFPFFFPSSFFSFSFPPVAIPQLLQGCGSWQLQNKRAKNFPSLFSQYVPQRGKVLPSFPIWTAF